MKNLELSQMENFQGGEASCYLATVATIGLGIGVAAVLTASGPIGWLAMAGGISGGISVGGGWASCAYNSTHGDNAGGHND